MKILIKILKIIIKIRYRVKISGLDLFNSEGAKLVFPSHVALMDPIILFCFLHEKGKISPLMTEYYYNIPILKYFFRIIGAISVTDLTKNKQKSLDTKQIIGQVINFLQEGNNVLIYPQGSLARQGFQSIVGKKTAFYATQQAPKDTKILTVNIRGLRGSRSSWAWNGNRPKLSVFTLKGLLFTLSNFLFFVPKRTVEIDIQDQTSRLHKSAEKGIDIFNQELEKIYNFQGEEEISYLSGLFWYNTTKYHKPPKKISGSLSDFRKLENSDYGDIPGEILKKIVSTIKKIKPEYKDKINQDTNLVLDCYFDSLDMAELKSVIQSSFSSASNPPLLDIKTVGDVAMMAMGKSLIIEEIKPCNRQYSKENKLIYSHIKPLIHSDSTILSLMKESFKDKKSESFCYDTIFGVQTKRDFLVKAYLIADILKKFPGERIAVMLPSLSATSLLILGCYLAKKVPVMLNRTQSQEAFSHCLKSQKIEIILTSKSFFQKVQTHWLKKYEMTFFEELLKNISLLQKIKAVYQSYRFQLPKNISQTAVVLFTSGSEALPKTVELTHKNILHDLLGAAGIVGIKMNDVEICFLPPFHSFGFILGIVLPLISGTRIVFTPDPNDSRTIANLIQHTKSTFLASTPTFLNGIVQSSKNDQFDSLRIAIVGAEKCPKELFTKFTKKAPQATIIEGYGITECSPIISVNPLKRNAKIKRGTVGVPILGERIKILDLETNAELPANKEGMIYIYGENIFSGYVDESLESPFIEINGQQRYKTGDLGYLDKDGYLTISGRLKRFIKIAGEMISLPAIESVLSRKRKSTSGEAILAIQPKEKSDGNVELVLFTTQDIELVDINKYLRDQGTSNLVSIDAVIKIKEIPLLGTGKIDYVQLKQFLVKNKTNIPAK